MKLYQFTFVYICSENQYVFFYISSKNVKIKVQSLLDEYSDGVFYSGLEIRCLYFSSHFLAFLFTLVAISFTLIAVPFHSVSVHYPSAFFN